MRAGREVHIRPIYVSADLYRLYVTLYIGKREKQIKGEVNIYPSRLNLNIVKVVTLSIPLLNNNTNQTILIAALIAPAPSSIKVFKLFHNSKFGVGNNGNGITRITKLVRTLIIVSAGNKAGLLRHLLLILKSQKPDM